LKATNSISTDTVWNYSRSVANKHA